MLLQGGESIARCSFDKHSFLLPLLDGSETKEIKAARDASRFVNDFAWI
jgi:hypothetical protein